MDKPIYRMSETGGCPRAMSAIRLGYEPIPITENDRERLDYYASCEALAANQIKKLGFTLQESEICLTCRDRYGNTRYGLHVELDSIMFSLMGHLDRRLLYNDKLVPVEIKSLGRFSWQNFKRYEFEKFYGYACQEACYLEAENSPGIYWVMNRDTGESLKYIINDYNNDIVIDDFKHITLPVTYQSIVDDINNIELCVQDGELVEAPVLSDCRYCRMRFLCGAEEKEDVVKEENLPSLVEAAQLYKDGHELERQGKDQKEQAKMSFVFHARDNKVPKFKVSGISISYRGQKTRKWLDEKILRESVSEEIIRLSTKESKPYDDISIRILKEEL